VLLEGHISFKKEYSVCNIILPLEEGEIIIKIFTLKLIK
jgi:hypothetical protein